MKTLALLACLLLAACATVPRDVDIATFIVVRHAEKVDSSRDPDLSAAGHARSRALEALLDGQAIAATYATGYKRTQQTVQPTAAAHALTVSVYDANQPAAEFAARLRADHPRGTVLVAGHSNTVPDIVAALCGCETTPMADSEFDRLSTIRIDATGNATLAVSRYGDASSTP